MADFLRYDHFDVLDSPVAVLSTDGKVQYRNRAAIGYSRAFRTGSRLAYAFPQSDETLKDCIRQRKPVIAQARLKDGASFTSLLIPDYSPEGACVLLVLAPMLEGRFCYGPSLAAFSAEPLVEGVAALPGGKTLSKLGEVLVRSYSALFLPHNEETRTMGTLCLFLNRLFERCFSCRSQDAFAKCTADCMDMPLNDFEGIASALSCLAVLLAVNAANERLEVFLSCRRERACIGMSLQAPERMRADSLSLLLPGRKVELSILAAYFDRLGYDISLSRSGGRLEIELFGRKRFPASFFKAPTPEEEKENALAVEELLARLGL